MEEEGIYQQNKKLPRWFGIINQANPATVTFPTYKNKYILYIG